MPYGQSGIGLLSFCLRKLQHKAKNPQYKNGQKTHALYPAVLVEQFFMDNKKDLAYLISDEGKRNLIDVIVGGVNMLHTQKFQDFIKI